MKYKMIAIDMDGTLLNDEKSIHPRNIEAIKKASEEGVKVVICTGRNFASALYYSDLIGVKTPIICSNGAMIREKDQDRVIYQSLLGSEKCKEIIKVLKEQNLNFNLYTANTLYTEELAYSSKFYEGFNKTLPKNRRVNIELIEDWEKLIAEQGEEISKAVAVDKDIEKVQKAKEVIKGMAGLEVVSSGKNNFEVMNEGVSKGDAMTRLAEIYGIDISEVIAIGDSENDLSMIELAGLGISMGNGEDYVKEAAQYITGTNNEGGVGSAIEKFILEKDTN